MSTTLMPVINEHQLNVFELLRLFYTPEEAREIGKVLVAHVHKGSDTLEKLFANSKAMKERIRNMTKEEIDVYVSTLKL